MQGVIILSPSMDTPLTPRQAEILEAIRTHVGEHGRPPSHPELARTLGLASTMTFSGYGGRT